MVFVVITDIHGNLPALKSVLKEIDKPIIIIFLNSRYDYYRLIYIRFTLQDIRPNLLNVLIDKSTLITPIRVSPTTTNS